MENYYTILGITIKASDKEIRDAYRRLAKKYHPDSNKGDQNAALKFNQISVASNILLDPVARKKYDTELLASIKAEWSQQPAVLDVEKKKIQSELKKELDKQKKILETVKKEEAELAERQRKVKKLMLVLFGGGIVLIAIIIVLLSL